MQKILVCDDDKQIVEAIDIYLTGEGFQVIKAYDGLEALELLKTNEVNLMIVDVMMPGLDGIRTTLKVRETSSIPIIILSAKSEDSDKILGLNIGADDYITKPFNPLELVARVKSQLRRYTQLGNMNTQTDSRVYKCGGLQINDENKEVFVDGELITRRILTARRVGPLTFEGLKRLGVVLKRAQYFLTCSGRVMAGLRVNEDGLLRHLLALEAPALVQGQPEQLSLFAPGS